MEQDVIDKYKVEYGKEAEAEEIIVLTGTLDEFERFCMATNRSTKNTFAVRQGFQIPMYDNLPIVLYGNYWLNQAYDSLEYKDRIFKAKLKDLGL